MPCVVRARVHCKITLVGSRSLSFISMICLNIDDDQINEYLVSLAKEPKSLSRSSFKHMVYGLRYYYSLLGMNKRAIALPSLKQEVKLLVILNRDELQQLFNAPNLLKQRVALTLIYSAGLRGQEVINLKIGDIDFERCIGHTCYLHCQRLPQ